MNGQFELKYGPSSASNGLAFWLSEKTVRKFAELRNTTFDSKKTGPSRALPYTGVTFREPVL